MKRKSEMDSKAGTGPIIANPTFKNIFSKSASLLLILFIGMSAMSFIQNDHVANGKDTNQSALKKKYVETIKSVKDNETCCIVGIINKGVAKSNAALISIPGKRDMYNADKATIVSFINESKSRKKWSLNKKHTLITADQEMYFNFLLSNIYPSMILAEKTDWAMGSHFLDDVVNITFLNTSAVIADEENATNFIAGYSYIIPLKSANELRMRADAEMRSVFEQTKQPMISMPSVADIQEADKGMIKNQR